jgi:AAA domain
MVVRGSVQNLFEPDARAMREHLDFMFGGYLDGLQDGLIELAWTDVRPGEDSRYKLRHAELFGTDRIDDLIAKAVALNPQPMCNVYVGAALRRPETPPFGRASASDVLALTCAYIDLDDPGRAEAAKDHYGGARPGRVVVTGKEPHTRAQMWWRLDEPITDQTASEALLKGMATVFGGDSVSDPPRVMRLAGTIAWPVKPDRERPELTTISRLREPGQAMYAYGHLARLFPLIPRETVDGVRLPGNDGITRAATALGMPGKVEDGRDLYLLRTSEAVMIQLIGETGKCPTPQELFDVVWPQYDRNVDPDKPRKREDYVAGKCAHTIKRFLAGRIRGCETIETALGIYRRKKDGGKYDVKVELPPKLSPAGNLILTSREFADSLQAPSYVIDGIIQRGFLYSLTARTHHGKTAVIMRAGAAIIRGEDFAGCKTRQGSVLFFAGENPQDIRVRYVSMCDQLGINTDTAPFYFIDGVVDIATNLERIRTEAEAILDLRLIIVDTAAAYFRGDDGNSNAQLGAYARLLRQLTFLPSLPTGIVNCHPIKNALQDNLLPMGGSAFVNEVDGNLTLWAEGSDKTTVLHWQGKFRGPEFEPVSFNLETISSERVKDAEGRLMPTVMAVHLPENVVERLEAVGEEEENTILRLLHADKNVSFSGLAKRAMFTKSKVQRIIKRLRDEKMVRKFRGKKYRVTRKGCVAAGIKTEDDFDDE